MSEGASPPAAPPSSGGLPPRLAGKYRPIRLVATGGMGAVYEVEHEHTGEHLALKVLKADVAELDPTAIDRFRREARVSAQVKSEHIVRVIDADVAPELGGVPFLVMDLLDGANLADVVGEEPQPAEKVVSWLAQIAPALDRAHALGIVHRDLKPENLFLTRAPDGRESVKILDFGVAKIRTDESVGQTAAGALLGTPLYMAPEQVEGAHDRVGPGTDMWSIALIAFRLLAGKDYWSSKNVSLLLVDILHGEMGPPSGRTPVFGAAFDGWFRRSCQRDPGARWPNVMTQVDALADALGVAGSAARAGAGADPGLAATLVQSPGSSPVAPSGKAAQTVSGSVSSVNTRTGAPGRGALGLLALAALAALAFLLLSRQRAPEEGSAHDPHAATRSVDPTSGVVTPRPALSAPAANATPDSGAPAVTPAPAAATTPAAAAVSAATEGAGPGPAPAAQPVRRAPQTAPRPGKARVDPLADPN